MKWVGDNEVVFGGPNFQNLWIIEEVGLRVFLSSSVL